MILPVGGHDRMGCFTDQVKLTRALVRDLEESSQKITELEALYKKLTEDTQRLEDEMATLEGMVESCNELLMEITRETGLDYIGDDDEEEEEEEEDDDDGGDAAAPPTATPPPPVPLLLHLRRSMKKALWR
jgi:cell division protein FtsB